MGGKSEVLNVLYPLHHQVGHVSSGRGKSDGELGSLGPVLELLREHTGRQIGLYKWSSIERRTMRRMQELGLEDPARYLDLLQTNPFELDALARYTLIGVTGFLRDPEAWNALSGAVSSVVLPRARQASILRAWVAGCSTGEEAYSLGALLLDALEEAGDDRPELQVFGTDVDSRSIDVARRGRYPVDVAEFVPDAWIGRHFLREGEGVRVGDELRSALTFATQDLLVDPPFRRMNLISCRNVLIYLKPAVQDRLHELFHGSLLGGGLLFLGQAESAPPSDLFCSVAPRIALFERLPDARSTGAAFPIAEQAPVSGRSPSLSWYAGEFFLERFAPPAVLVGSNNQILHYFGDSSTYLRQPPGAPSHHLSTLCVESLRPSVVRAVEAARAAGSEVTESVADLPLTITACPLEPTGSEVLVCFEEGGAASAPDSLPLDEGTKHVMEQLTRTNNELRAGRDEALSFAEELQAAMEEHTAAREELESLTEELAAVNAQLKSRVEQVQTAHQDWMNLIQSTGTAAIFLDVDLHIRLATPGIRQHVPVRDTDLGRPISELTTRIDDVDLAQLAHRVLADSKAVELEIESAGRSCLLRAVPYQTGSGGVGGVVFVVDDISVLAERRKALERSRAHLSEAQRVAALGSWEWELATDELSWSDQARRMLTRAGNPVPSTIDAYLAACLPEDRPRMREAIQGSRASRALMDIEHRILSPEGTLSVVALRGRSPPSRPGCLVGTIRDLTKQRRAEEEQRRSEERYQTFSRLSPVGMALTDADGRLRYANEPWKRLHGSPDDISADVHWLHRVHPDDRADVLERWADRNDSDFQAEYRVVEAAGSNRWIHALAAPERSSHGAVVGWIATAWDVTRRREAEFRLRRAARMEIVGQLASGLAHDFNNLLTIVIGNLEAALSDGPESTGELMSEALVVSRRCTRLTKRLLQFAQRTQLSPVATDILAMLTALVPMLERTLGDHIRVVVQSEDEAAFALVDPAELESAIVNLVVNARDAMPEGGLILLIVERSEDWISLIVRDEGVGMDEATLARATQPFFSTKPDDGHSGLGLSSVFGFAGQSGGRLTIESAPGLGSSVALILPATSSGPPGRASAEPVVSGTRHVLVVDDNPRVGEVVCRLVRRLGHRCSHVASAAEARRVLNADVRVDTLITDCQMPGESGERLAEWARTRDPDLLVVLTSGYTEQRGRSGETFLQKPIGMTELQRVLGASVDGRE